MMLRNEASPQTVMVVGARQNQHHKYTALLDSMQESHLKRTLRHLLDYGSITSIEAFTEYGNTRLSATIYTLKNTFNVPIISTKVQSKNRYGDKTSYAKYVLGGEENDTVESSDRSWV